MRVLANLTARVAALFAAGGFLALLYSLRLVEGTTAWLIAALYLLAAFAAAVPTAALMLVAASIPIASWMGRSTNETVAWAETLVVAFCAGYCARVAATSVDRPRNRLGPPLFVTGAVVAASLVVQVFIDVWRFGPTPTQERLWDLFTHFYFVSFGSSDPIDAGMRLIESLILLGAASALSQQHPRFSRRLLSAILIGATAAATLNVWRLWEATLRFNRPFAAFMRYLATERVNVHYADLNAAGSYFVMTLFASAGLALVAGRRRWIPAVWVIAFSIWITGSRSAMFAGALAVLLPAAAYASAARRGASRLVIAAVAMAVLLAAGAGAYYLPHRGNQQAAGIATSVRWELAQTSLRMTASRPFFGVGLGGYYARSGEFASPELLRIFPPAVHENAHNNFFQVLAELGIIGFAAFMWLLVKAAVLCAMWIRADPRDPARWGVATGLLAFVLSWLGGHPLLIDEPAFSFWLLVGTACAASAWVASPEKTARIRWMVAAVVVAVAASIPVRVQQQRGDFDLEHRGIGLSHWQTELDGRRYRVAGATSSVFVPAYATSIVLALRPSRASETLRVTLELDGRPANDVSAPGDHWTVLHFPLPQNTTDAKFRRLDLKVTNVPSTASNVLFVGKVEPR